MSSIPAMMSEATIGPSVAPHSRLSSRIASITGFRFDDICIPRYCGIEHNPPSTPRLPKTIAMMETTFKEVGLGSGGFTYAFAYPSGGIGGYLPGGCGGYLF